MPQLKIFDTLTRTKRDFVPLKPEYVTFYQCGPTVYWVQHIGNMRAMVMADLVHRTLLYLGYSVKFVRNYTDVGHLTSDQDEGEDKMTKGARREGLTPDEIADKYIKFFENDVVALNTLPADIKPRATEYIKEMLVMVEELVNKGFAYITPKAVYFNVKKAKGYTRLSRQKLEDNKIGAGAGEVIDPAKKNPQDFAIWFFRTGQHKNALQFWPSPFKSAEVENGEGFPGWHIECSAMIKAELDETIDLHMGGIEHIPVHHTNEIAQSESANGKDFVRYWLHNEWLMIDGEKISKSSGNFVTLEEVVAKGFDPLALRYLFLGAHYRSQQNFTWGALQSAHNALKRLKKELKNLLLSSNYRQGKVLELWHARFTKAISDDINLPSGLAVVWDIFKDPEAQPEDKLETILDFDRVLGLNLEESINSENLQDSHNKNLSVNDSKQVEALISERNQARSEKDWAKADKIRDTLLSEFGVKVVDN